MEYWTYENWRADGHKATIHVGHCGSCNHGQGKHGVGETPNGRWHGPFSSPDRAKSVVRSGAYVRPCQICVPTLQISGRGGSVCPTCHLQLPLSGQCDNCDR